MKEFWLSTKAHWYCDKRHRPAPGSIRELETGSVSEMSWRTGIAVLSFFALVAVIQYPRLAEYLREFTEPSTTVAVPDPMIASPADTDTPSTDPSQSISRTISDANITVDELKLLALDYINEDRKLNGLNALEMGDNESAQLHAEDMVAGTYLGHWWLDGRKPYMVYSENGGSSYVSENAARTGFSEDEYEQLCTGANITCEKVNPMGDIQRLQYAMVYDDAGSDWRHRVNILNPDHRKVNIGIAYTDRFLAFVQHFEGGDVTAPRIPIFKGSQINIRADLNRPGVTIFPTVQVHYEEMPVERSGDDIEQFTTYCVGGGFSEECGDPLVQILPPPQPGTRYVNLPENVIVAKSWVISGGDIEIIADLGSFADEPGIYTTTMFEDKGNGVSGSILMQLSTIRG